MDRRKFFEQVAAWSAGVCLATPVFDVRAILSVGLQVGLRDLVAWKLCEACLDVEAASIMLFE